MKVWLSTIVATILPFALSGCSPTAPAVDLLQVADSRLREASVVGRGLDWVLGQKGKQLRLHDVVQRTLPATPPSELRFVLDVPRNARLAFSCAIAEEFHDEPAVEFVVKVRARGREETIWTLVVDPIGRPEHRRWVPAAADLSRHAGRGVEIILETRGFEAQDELRQAFWGAPAIVAEGIDSPLVVLYLVDTLRADHTTPYGYERDTTPALQKLSREAVLFEAAIAHASWTKPSVASLFTSTLPGRHRAVQLRDRLEPGLVTLAEMLQVRGYATGAAVANSVIYSAGSHFEQGFDFFAGLHGANDRPSKLVEAAGVVDTALEWIDARRGLPTFLYVHTMDPHVPYSPPPPFDRLFEPYPTPDHPGVDPRYDYKEPLDRERLVAQYDGSIAYGDQEFGRFLEELKGRGLYDDALIIFLGDHGEEFLDHGQWLHGRSVFDELIRVPLVVRFPGGRDGGQRVAQQVQVVDILPTILENEGLPVPPPPIISGRPLQRVVAGGAPEPTAVSEISHRGIVAHGIRTHRDKYVRTFSPEESEMYFDLLNDPKESENRLGEAPERAAKLRAAVEAAMVSNPFRHTLRFAGRGVYELSLKTGGWIEGVEVKGFGSADSHWLGASGRRLALQVSPRPGRPREVAFSIRPRGAPVRLDGTRDGRPLRAADVLIAREAVHPAGIPFLLPEIESESERVENIFTAPAADLSGVHVWLVLAPGRHVMELDAATRERLKALGYLDN